MNSTGTGTDTTDTTDAEDVAAPTGTPTATTAVTAATDGTGQADNAGTAGTADGTGRTGTADAVDASRRRWPRVLGALLAVALIAAGGALYAEGRQLRDTPATANLALTDAEATARVTGDVSSALGKIFSYGPGSTAATRAAAKEVLAGKALQQYAALFGQVERQSADQKLTLTTEVVRAGVTRLTGSGAHLLVFLDQVYERRGRAPTTASAQLTVTAELRDGRWWIVEIGTT
ncbi:Mce-associated membrane protein [Streptomyces sp. OspMP-M43]|nr:Mce-associated membrane protein [Streptomyces sp. OspMP-M43]